MLKIQGTIDGPEATVYPDDKHELTWYVLPQVPTLRRDGNKAIFKFVKYRTLKPLASGKNGAALVFMDVQLALTAAEEQAVRKRIADAINARRGPNNPAPVQPAQIVLSKPPVIEASVSVDILASSGDLVQRVNNAGKPSMYGNNVVAISAELTEFGAPAFAGIMQSEGAGGVRVNYVMKFAGRMPPISVIGTWHASKFYSFVQDVDFEENFWSEDDFSEKVSEVFANSESRDVHTISEGVITTDPEMSKAITEMEASVGRQLDEAVKRNLLEAIPPESRDFSAIRDEDFENIHREVTTNKTSDVTITLKRDQVVPVDVEPQGNMLSLVSQGFTWSDYALELDLDDKFFKQLNLNIRVNAPFEELPIFSVQVLVDYPPHTAAHGIQTFTFQKADDIGKFTAFTNGGPTDYKYRYVVHYKGESRVFESQWKDAQGTDLIIDVDELGLWLVDIAVGDINFSQVARAVLTLAHPEVSPGVPPVRRFQIDKEHTDFEIKELLLEPVQPYSGSIRYFMADGAREYVKQFTGQAGQAFYVDDPFAANLSIKVRTRGNFVSEIDKIFLDLGYSDVPNDYRQTTSIALSKDKRDFDWTFPVIDDKVGVVTYRAITTFVDGTSEDAGEQTLIGTTLLLGRESAELKVKLTPDLIPWDQVKLARAEIHYVDPVNQIDEREGFTFRSGNESHDVTIPIRNIALKTYTWTVTFFMADGTRREAASSGPVGDEEIIIELPA